MKKKLQVFISSTFTDLIEERQAAVGAILKAGHIPAGMELFTAGDRSQMTTIKEWIDESDVYMLILGGRYGTIEKGSGISYTELEYNYALELGKPLFAVVITEQALENKIRLHGTSFGEKENPKELAMFRDKVLSNISSFFEDHKDIKLCVHESLADFSSKRELKGWISGVEVVETRPLFEEIQKLSEENKSLRETIASLERKNAQVANKESAAEGFSELLKILRAIDIKVPSDVSGEKEFTADLFSILYSNKDVLINGVTNSAAGSKVESFYYHNVCPKLQLHGLIINEKVAGVRYRRSFLSELGNKFLSHVEKNILLDKQKESESTSPDEKKVVKKPRAKKEKI